MADRLSHERASLARSPREDDVSGISTPTEIGHYTQDPSTNKHPVLSTEESLHNMNATLERSAVQEWFSTVVDSLLSLAPLFFLSKSLSLP